MGLNYIEMKRQVLYRWCPLIGAVFGFWGLLAPGAAAQTSPVVWVISSLDRVKPTDPAGSGILAQLAAARGEYQSFQITIRAPQVSALTNVNVIVSDLSGPAGAVIPKSNVALFREQYVNVNVSSPAWQGSSNLPGPPGWYPDGLIPFIDPSTGQPPVGGSLKAVPFNVTASNNQPIWVDIFVPPGTPAGSYTGTFTVTSDQGNVVGQIALVVWNFTLPLTPSLQSSFQFWTAGNTAAANAELLRNRIQPQTAPTTSESQLIAGYGLQDYNLGYFSGANYGNCKMSSPPSVSQIKATVTAQQPGLAFYNYSADEISGCTNLYTTVQQWAQNLHQAGVNQLVTMAPVPQLFTDGTGSGRSAVDIWVMLPDQYDAAQSNIQTVLAKGDQVWSYNDLVQDSYSPKWEIDFPLIDYRIQGGFINQSLGMNGLLYWRIDDWSSDPWNNVYGYAGFPGEGMLVYPGSTVGIQGVAPSMRLKALRDGTQDYEYIQLLKNAGQGAWALSVAATVGASWHSWTQSPNTLLAARLQLGQKLDQLGGGQPGQLPGAPVNPAPGNGATGVSPSPIISWISGGNTNSYGIYFGTSQNPPLAGNTPNTSYVPGSLSSGTTYYWKVVATNANGSTSSALWSFTTASAAAPPPAPTNLNPAAGTGNVPLTPTLSWSASSGATSYDVYFGTSANPSLLGNTTNTSYAPGTLAASTTYYWRVVAKNASGSSSSATISLTTTSSNQGPVSVSPAAGSGFSATFAFSFSNSAGYTSLSGGTVIVNRSLGWSNACWIYYDRTNNLIWLASNDTTTWTSATPGSSAVLQNSQCAISAAGSSVTASGTILTAKIAITFNSAFAGTEKVYMSANNSNGTATPLTVAGSWIVP